MWGRIWDGRGIRAVGLGGARLRQDGKGGFSEPALIYCPEWRLGGRF